MVTKTDGGYAAGFGWKRSGLPCLERGRPAVRPPACAVCPCLREADGFPFPSGGPMLLRLDVR